MRLEFNYYSGWVGVGWSDKTKVIPNSTQLKFKLNLEFEFGKNCNGSKVNAKSKFTLK